jgi:hypothetical protein
LAAVLLSGCVTSEVTYLGSAKYPSKPEGCKMESFPSTTPDAAWDDLATVEARCHVQVSDRSACIEELQKQACRLGGDFIYAFKDGTRGANLVVIATVARRKEGAEAKEVAKTGEAPSAPAPLQAKEEVPAAPETSCDPPCSPGFKCSAGVCEPQCNPACEAGEVCSRRRVCEPAPAAPAR